MDIVPPLLVKDKARGDLWQDHNDLSVRAILEAPRGKGKPGYGLKVTDRDLTGGVEIVAHLNAFHPVRDYFEQLRWDGRERLSKVLIEYLACPDTPYHREVIGLMLTAAVARVYEPGHKFDNALIIEGKQGIRKSTFIRTLAKGWFSELHGDLGDQKKMVEQTVGFLILELPELTNLRRSEVEDTKSFLSRIEDTVRLA
jgi:predicted P-loop ATPase